MLISKVRILRLFGKDIIVDDQPSVDNKDVETATSSPWHASSRTIDQTNGGKLGKKKRDDNQDPSQEEIPEPLLQAIEACGGTKPVFLYQKQLEESDTKAHYNKLFMNRRDKLVELLNDKEVEALNDVGQGLEIPTLDPQGESYKLMFKVWQNGKQGILNSGWNKIVKANNVHMNDWVKIWGYRENVNLRLLINFKKK